MPPVGFEATISASERPQTYVLDREATGHQKTNNIERCKNPEDYHSIFPVPSTYSTFDGSSFLCCLNCLMFRKNTNFREPKSFYFSGGRTERHIPSWVRDELLPIVHKTINGYLLYRAFHNVLWNYKNLLYENRRTRIYENCTDRRNNSKYFFPSKLFFVTVHISAARRCECM